MTTQTDLQTKQNEATAAFQAGDYPRAAELFASAAQEFASQGDELMAAEMRNNQSVALLQDGDGQAAWQACQGTDVIFAKAGDTRRQALAIGNQAAALEKLGKWQDAIAKYEQANELLKTTGDEEMRRFTLQALSSLQMKHNRYLEAMVNTQASLASKPRLSLRERFLRWLIGIFFGLLHRPPAV